MLNRTFLKRTSHHVLLVTLLGGVTPLAQNTYSTSAAGWRSDGQIESDVVHSLDAANALKNDMITVATIQSEVTLSGTVLSPGNRQLAEMLVRQVEGVTKVHNNLQVNNPQNGQQTSDAGYSGQQQIPSSQSATSQAAGLQYGTQQPAAPRMDSRASGKKKIAIYPFDDRTSANRPMSTAEIISGHSLGQGLGVKVSDAIISKLAGTGDFEVVDREYLNSVMAEKNLKYDPNFDPAGAARAFS
jgi:hypothetical protein